MCATFIATGIVTDVDRMGRILKLLISALENFSSESTTTCACEIANGMQVKLSLQLSVI